MLEQDTELKIKTRGGESDETVKIAKLNNLTPCMVHAILELSITK